MIVDFILRFESQSKAYSDVGLHSPIVLNKKPNVNLVFAEAG